MGIDHFDAELHAFGNRLLSHAERRDDQHPAGHVRGPGKLHEGFAGSKAAISKDCGPPLSERPAHNRFLPVEQRSW